MRVGRKRIVLVEKITDAQNKKQYSMLRGLGLPFFMNMEFYRKNRFEIELKSDDGTIDSERINGFKINTFDGVKTITIKTVLHIDSWIEDFEKMNIARIYFIDGMGNEIKSFDFDISYNGYSMECDYGDDNILMPMFSYKILD